MPVSPSRDRRRSSRGQSLVELALIAPVFLILLLTAIDLGRLMYSQITITNAAKEGALVASQGGTWQANAGCSDTNTVMCGALTEAQGGFIVVDQTAVNLSPAVCDKDAPYPAGGPPTVTVEVTAPFRLVTPIVASIVGNNIVLHASADAECLAVPAVTFPTAPDPVAAFTATPMSGNAPLDVTFDGSGSTAPGATITDYSWSFGASGPVVTHTYSAAGSYTVVLTVTDSRGHTGSSNVTINVGATPTAPPPSCPTIDFTWVDRHNNGNPHRMDLNATLSPATSGYNYAWSGAFTVVGPSNRAGVTVNFTSGGSQTVAVTATLGSCTVTTTKTVPVP
ncbi:MAG TPA: PKD domain-containing protein [Candidatus Limnocylindrales bacterium]|nr:PKD domain-containing protein [Candidatus Limnocylindrales bacterium]